MIFIILGTQKFQFNRLLEQVDALLEENYITEEVFAQIGYSTYTPKNYKYKNFLEQDAFKDITQKADLVITHAGTGAIITALQNNKKVIAVPRLSKYGEHVDDHQIEIASVMQERGYIEVITEVSDLKNTIEKVRNRQYIKYKSSNERIIKIINDFIDNIE